MSQNSPYIIAFVVICIISSIAVAEYQPKRHQVETPPPTFPTKFAWLLHLKEWHDGPDGINSRIDFTEGQYYFDYSQTPLATRQQNNVMPNTIPAGWREDIPWNYFVGVNGTIYRGYLNATSGRAVCAPPAVNVYDDKFWPQDLLQSPELCKYVGIQQLSTEFDGNYNDGAMANAYICRSASGAASFTGTFYTDLETNSRFIRVSIDRSLPWWNKQLWDTTLMQEMEFPAGYWTIPDWLKCAKH